MITQSAITYHCQNQCTWFTDKKISITIGRPIVSFQLNDSSFHTYLDKNVKPIVCVYKLEMFQNINYWDVLKVNKNFTLILKIKISKNDIVDLNTLLKGK